MSCSEANLASFGYSFQAKRLAKAGYVGFPGDHTCHASCNGGPTCPSGAPICDPTGGACVGCNQMSNCPATRPIGSTATSQCIQCTQNGDCPAASSRCLLASSS